MSNRVQSIPDGYHSVTPSLVIRGGNQAIDFYKKAFGAEELVRMMSPDGTQVMHAALRIGNSIIMLSDEFPQTAAKSPTALNGSTMQVHIYVEDADATFRQALDAGAKEVMPLENTFWGDRFGSIVDPFGHMWGIATHIEDVSAEEMEKRFEEFKRKMAVV